MAFTPRKLSTYPDVAPLTGAESVVALQGSPYENVLLNIITLREWTLRSQIRTETANTTLGATDAGGTVIMNVGSSHTVTVPSNGDVAFPIGTSIAIVQYGSGQTEIDEGSGVTVRTPETLLLRKQYSSAALLKIDTNEWLLTGDLEAL